MLLTEGDWDEAGQVASEPDFRDFIAAYIPFPSIAPFAAARPHPEYEDRCQLEPGYVMNVMAFLHPNDWDEMLARYQK
ncbi:hypothetical protein [Collimonas arenae]|uniref:hypothetical protein n=1 Tax=Collimonas arenae TaxID=279058 RepID=UPI000FE14188|nr:hypothetical protein [Collimonas arenae]